MADVDVRHQNTLEFTFELAGRGWARFSLSQDGQGYVLFASYLSDALRDFLMALNAIMSGALRAVCMMQDEPGEYRWIFEREVDRLRVKVIRFEKNFSHQSDAEGLPCYEVTCNLEKFSRLVLTELEQVLELYGIDGYRAEWRSNDFPLHEYERLRSLIGE